jgi:uncharacterized membrane protein
MELQTLHWKAISYCFLSFIAVWAIWNITHNIHAEGAKSNESVFYTTSAISGLLPGYTASVVSRKSFVIHCIITGLLISIALFLFWALLGALTKVTLYNYVATPTFFIVLSIIGGVIAKLQGKTA